MPTLIPKKKPDLCRFSSPELGIILGGMITVITDECGDNVDKRVVTRQSLIFSLYLGMPDHYHQRSLKYKLNRLTQVVSVSGQNDRKSCTAQYQLLHDRSKTHTIAVYKLNLKSSGRAETRRRPRPLRVDRSENDV